MLEGLTPDLAPRLVLAIGGVGIAFVVLILVLIFLKRRNSPLFIKGGKSREPRLLVLDAAAVDPKRRLVLIRRDDVEHLIMIGGPTDIVIESGISDRSRQATLRAAAVEEPVTPRATPVQPPEARQASPAVERRPEPARPTAATQPEKMPAPAVEQRTAPAVSTQTVRTAASVVPPSEKMPPSVNRLMEEPRLEGQRQVGDVSAAGGMLYGEDREPMTGGGPVSPTPAPVVTAELPRAYPADQPVGARRTETVASVATAAEAVLEAARSRVLNAAQVGIPGRVDQDSARVAATRTEQSQSDVFRRVQSAQPTTQTAARPASQHVDQDQPIAEPQKSRDVEPSDFEKLLEAELDASGVFGQQTPKVRADNRVSSAVAADPALAPTRRPPPITGATPDVTSESEVARLLGEIAVNRKT